MSGLEIFAVVAAVAAAGAYLFHRARRFFKPSLGGGCCGKCPVARSSAGR